MSQFSDKVITVITDRYKTIGRFRLRRRPTNEAILRKIPKTSFLARFGPFWPKNGQMDFFLKNRATSVFIIYGPLTSCKKSEKNNEPILRKASDRQTD